jgi:hypothetical protein
MEVIKIVKHLKINLTAYNVIMVLLTLKENAKVLIHCVKPMIALLEVVQAAIKDIY